MTTTMTRSSLAITVTTLGTILLATTAFAKSNFAATASKYAVTKAGTPTKNAGVAPLRTRLPPGALNNAAQQITNKSGTGVPPLWSRLPPGALNNAAQQILNKSGTGTGNGGGSVVSCSHGTGCTTGKPGHGGHYGGGHYGWGHHGYKEYGWRWWYRSLPVYVAVDYVDGCEFEYKPRIRWIPGFGLRRVLEKVCIAEI